MITNKPIILNADGKKLKPYLKEIGKLRIRVFREFPYLYDGSAEYEREYLQKYIESDRSIAVMAFDNDKLVGCSTAIPLADESEAFQKPFIEAGISPETVFYCGESVLLKEYRGLGIYKHFFKEREHHAKRIGDFDLITFCAVSRPEDHPLRPNDYTPLDRVWEKYGYQKREELRTTFPWKDLDETKESDKEMVFWTKKLLSGNKSGS